MPNSGMRNMFFKTSPSRSPPKQRTTVSDSLMDESIEVAQSLISKWNAETSNFAAVTSLFFDDRNEAKQYLAAVGELHHAMQFFGSDRLVHAQSLMQQAMKRLEKEFYQILSTNRQFLDSESVSSRVSVSSRASPRSSVSDLEDNESDNDELRPPVDKVETASTEAMADLKSIADCMVSSGYAKECVKIYKISRKSIVDETLYNLGVERLTFSQVQKMDWDVLEVKIKAWLNAIKVAVKTLFYGERQLCDYVFSSSASIRESCFSEIAKEGALTLFEFPEFVARCKKSPEKMFRTLDLYEAISHNWTEIESIFSSDSMAFIRTQASNARTKLNDAVCAMLADFEAMVQKDTSKKPLPGGGVHPATRYIMNYIQFLADYSDSLAEIIADWPAPQAAPLPESYFESSASAISVRFAWLILVLLCKVDGRAQLYNNVALSYLFLANNLQYIIVKVRSSNLKHLLGENWIANHHSKVKQYASSYERIGWSKVFTAIPSPAASISLEEAQESFGKFNTAFTEAYKKQVSWVVTDPKLRDEIKYSLAEKLIPAYGVSYQKYRIPLSRQLGAESCVRYAPEDLDNNLCDLFYSSGDAGSHSSSTATMSCPFPIQSRGLHQGR